MSKHILTVDDEVHIRRLIEVNLQRAGYRVTTAGDGEEALRAIGAERPDLVILDVMMPRIDGFEVLRRLKADPSTADLAVIMLTAKAQDADVFRGWQSGAEWYLTKPFNPQQLLLLIRRFFESSREQPESGGRIYL